MFHRCGRSHWQPLWEASGIPRREAVDTRMRAEYAAREREFQGQLRRAAEQRKAEREARRPLCADCGTKFTDERWKAFETPGWGPPRVSHAQLCDDCAQRAVTAERQAHQARPCPSRGPKAAGSHVSAPNPGDHGGDYALWVIAGLPASDLGW